MQTRSSSNALKKNESPLVAGVDVGGPRRGFHAVLMRDTQVCETASLGEAAAVARWCRKLGAKVIAVDAPCRWSSDGKSRPAECALRAEGIGCFSTPTHAMARTHPTGYYDWMRTGARLFSLLEKTHPLFDGRAAVTSEPVSIETFPHAVACALAGRIVSARGKRSIRRGLLERAGVDLTLLTNIDLVDAALCGLAATALARGAFRTYGERKSGYIVVPSTFIPRTAP